jgi:DNA-binding beta-propeller fold protein YncE
VDPNGYLYVADSGNHRIQKLSGDGVVLAQWGSRGTGPGYFDRPSAVAVDGQGDVYVLDGGNRRIQRLSPVGEPIIAWGGADGLSWQPVDVAVDGKGNLYVADLEGQRVLKLAPAARSQRPRADEQARPPAGPAARPGKAAHEVLAVGADATLEEVTAAFRRLARQYHPDRVADLGPEFSELAERRMKEINAAYETLKRQLARDS